MLQFKSVSGIRLLDRLRSQIFLKIYHNYQKSMQYEERLAKRYYTSQIPSYGERLRGEVCIANTLESRERGKMKT